MFFCFCFIFIKNKIICISSILKKKQSIHFECTLIITVVVCSFFFVFQFSSILCRMLCALCSLKYNHFVDGDFLFLFQDWFLLLCMKWLCGVVYDDDITLLLYVYFHFVFVFVFPCLCFVSMNHRHKHFWVLYVKFFFCALSNFD